LLTRTAFVALWRISEGKPAFRSYLPPAHLGGRRAIVAAVRREAIQELIRLRYVRPGKTGPTVTQTGLEALRKLRSVSRGDTYQSQFGVTHLAAGERYSTSKDVMDKRAERLRQVHDAI
jgi:hypothetical protein